jgi:peptidoglycan/LPS O-acetylase OafA/YrhL
MSHIAGERATPRRAGREHLSSLDGIRAFAVCAVLLYHAGVSGVSGGLLGVDVFFVLSGFLITSLLCGEHRERGSIRLGQFWARRAKRLLPALFLLLLGVAVYAWVLRNSLDVSSIRGDALSTLLYFANWHFIFSGQGYSFSRQLRHRCCTCGRSPWRSSTTSSGL